MLDEPNRAEDFVEGQRVELFTDCSGTTDGPYPWNEMVIAGYTRYVGKRGNVIRIFPSDNHVRVKFDDGEIETFFAWRLRPLLEVKNSNIFRLQCFKCKAATISTTKHPIKKFAGRICPNCKV